MKLTSDDLARMAFLASAAISTPSGLAPCGDPDFGDDTVCETSRQDTLADSKAEILEIYAQHIFCPEQTAPALSADWPASRPARAVGLVSPRQSATVTPIMPPTLSDQIRANCADLRQRYGVKRLGVFGSVARGDEAAHSDIDLLVEFADPHPAHMPEHYFGFRDAAARRFGRPVQLLTPRMVRNPFLRRSLDRDLKILHG